MASFFSEKRAGAGFSVEPWAPEGKEGLELVAHVIGMEQFHEGLLFAGESGWGAFDDAADGGFGMVHEKGFLTLQADVLKLATLEYGFEFFPEEVTGNIALAGVGQEVGAHGVAGVGASGSLRPLVEEGLSLQAVVEGEE